MWGYCDVEMWRCGDIVMWRCGDVGMWRCGDVGMWGCGDVGMWGCGDCDVGMSRKKPFSVFYVSMSIYVSMCRKKSLGLCNLCQSMYLCVKK